ncbi:MAG: 16S rRNA (guanine(527)-N(7))-methyltransferase RsmG [Bacilli bacterium]|nr:16S rRNA (guanine(527)-N(7))-methyltransferase RsmG [Bacilli bacterium]
MEIDNFIEELKKINIEITDTQLIQLDKYYELLIEYNKVMNLTGITEKKEVYLKHFYDSLTISKIMDLTQEETLCDIGTGAGFPGIVLKILYPNLHVTLVDSLKKRIIFLKKVIEELKLENIEAIHARAEEFAQNNREKYDVVTSRAVAQLNILLELSIPIIKTNKYFISYKGNISQEIIESQNALKQLNCKIEKKLEFELPIEKSNRTLLKIVKEKSTSKKFPRKYSEIKKRPI